MSEIMWFLTRSSGIVALVLLLAAVADGLIFSGREGGRRLRPAWWLDLHRGLGGYALIFTAVHLLTAFASSDTGVGLAQVFVPNASRTSTGAFTLGVLAFYGMAATVFSTWPKKLLRRRAWHAVHLLSIPAAVFAVLHAYQLGSDVRSNALVAVCLLFVGVALYAAGLRLSGISRRRAERRAEMLDAARRAPGSRSLPVDVRPAPERADASGRVGDSEPLPPPITEDRELVLTGRR